MSNFLFWTWPILFFFGVAAIKGIFGKPRIKPGYAGFAEQQKKEDTEESSLSLSLFNPYKNHRSS